MIEHAENDIEVEEKRDAETFIGQFETTKIIRQLNSVEQETGYLEYTSENPNENIYVIISILSLLFF